MTANLPTTPVAIPSKSKGPYDSNAVRVVVDDLNVGFVNRDDAPVVQRAVLHHCEHDSRPVSIRGEIIGGWKDGDDEGNYGIWLYCDESIARARESTPKISDKGQTPQP